MRFPRRVAGIPLPGGSVRAAGAVRRALALVCAGAWAVPCAAQVGAGGPAVVGAAQPFELAFDHAAALEAPGGYVWSARIPAAGASFVKAHLLDVQLRPGDVLVLRSQSGRVVEEIRGRGPRDRGTFWSLSALGEELLLELRYARAYARPPFRIDAVLLGDPRLLAAVPVPEDVCGPPDFEDAFCYESDPVKWANVLASVGVMTVGGDPTVALFCSGVNVSPESYVLTNQHCISSQGQCDTAEFVFGYYREGCDDGAPPSLDWQSFRCETLLAVSPLLGCEPTPLGLDFALCSVVGDPAATYGFVEPDPVAPADGEALYVVQHPDGRPHEITHGEGADVDVDVFALRTYGTLDTEPGSSGAPMFRASDGKLVGLHHCGGCPVPGVGNRGVLMRDVYPSIAPYLCSQAVSLVPDGPFPFSEVSGNGDVSLDPGETWEFTPVLRNVSCVDVALDVTAVVAVSPSSAQPVTLLSGPLVFGTIPATTSAPATTPVAFVVGPTAACGGEIAFDLLQVGALGVTGLRDAPRFATERIGVEPRATLLYDGFGAGPAGWQVVDGGVGGGAAATWTTDNPGGRDLPLTAPFFIVDSDSAGNGAVQDEELISPPVDATCFSRVVLQFTHDFHWHAGGRAERADVDVRSAATGGLWVTLASFYGADATGTVTVDLSSRAAGQPDVQVRFRYHEAQYEWWWAVDDVFLIGSNGFVCDRPPGPTGGSLGRDAAQRRSPCD